MLLADHRPAHHDPADGGEEEQVEQRLALGPQAGGFEPLAHPDPGQRTLVGERLFDRGDRTLGFPLADPLLAQAPCAGLANRFVQPGRARSWASRQHLPVGQAR